MELSDYLRVLRRFWVSIAALLLVGLLGGAVASLVATPTYTSSTKLFLTVQSADTAGDLAQGSTYTERQVRSFAEVATAPIVLQPVIDKLGLGLTPAELAKRVEVSVPTNTATMDIAVVDTDPQRATDTAAGIAEGLVGAVSSLAPKNSAGQATVQANIITPATIPTARTSPRVAMNLALGLLVGALVGVGQAVLRRVLDTKVRTAEDVAQVTDVPVVGAFAFDADAPQHPLVVLTDPHTPRAEDFRRLRTNLQFLGVGSAGRTIAISSCVAGEGKSTTTINLGLALAAAGQRVLLVDADLRRPRLAARFHLEDAVGLTTVLIGQAQLAEVVQTGGPGVDVLAAGQVPPNPSELLGSDAMRALLAQASKSYDYVLLDCAPLVPVTDTAVLSNAVGGVLVVLASGVNDGDLLVEAIESVRAADGQVLGVILNKQKREDVGYRSSSYYRREGYTNDEGEIEGEVAATVSLPRRQLPTAAG